MSDAEPACPAPAPDPEPATAIPVYHNAMSLQVHVLNQLLRLLVKRRLRRLPLNPGAIAAARRELESYVLRRNRRLAPKAVITACTLGGRPAERIVAVPAPAGSTPGPLVLYLHGGAFLTCSPRTHRPITVRLAASSGAEVFVPDYRLAPEHPFPAALEDALAAYRQLLEQTNPATRIVLAGDSAGGNLVLALLHRLRAAGLPLPAGAICFSPWTDLTASGASLQGNRRTEVMLPPERMQETVHLYAADRDLHDPLISPLFGDFAGLPPLLLHAGSGEILLDDTLRVAQRASVAGVEVHCRIWHGQPHVFQIFAPRLPEATQAMAEAAEFVRLVTAPGRIPA